MTAPYQDGDTVAWIDIHPDGVRIHQADIDTIEPAVEPDRWLITTDRGSTTVDHTGVGADAIPLDPDIAADLYVYGDGYLVTATLIELDHGTEQNGSLDQGDDLGFA